MFSSLLYAPPPTDNSLLPENYQLIHEQKGKKEKTFFRFQTTRKTPIVCKWFVQAFSYKFSPFFLSYFLPFFLFTFIRDVSNEKNIRVWHIPPAHTHTYSSFLTFFYSFSFLLVTNIILAE